MSKKDRDGHSKGSRLRDLEAELRSQRRIDYGWIGRPLTEASAASLDEAARRIADAAGMTYRPSTYTQGIRYIGSEVLKSVLGVVPRRTEGAPINPGARRVADARQIIADAPYPIGGNLLQSTTPLPVFTGAVTRQGVYLQVALTTPPSDLYPKGQLADEQHRLCGTYNPDYDQNSYRRAEEYEFAVTLGELLLEGGRRADVNARLAQIAPEYVPSVVMLGQLDHVPRSH